MHPAVPIVENLPIPPLAVQEETLTDTVSKVGLVALKCITGYYILQGLGLAFRWSSQQTVKGYLSVSQCTMNRPRYIAEVNSDGCLGLTIIDVHRPFETGLAEWVAREGGRAAEVAEKIKGAFYGDKRQLDLSYLGLKSLPPEIGNLTSLTDLDLQKNQLQSLPAEIGNLTSLIRL